MSADFTPIYNAPADLKPFRYWCQKVLPLVYDDTLSYYELLCKVVDYLNKTMEDVNTLGGDVEALHAAYVQLQDYVNTYFDNLDMQSEIDQKLDEMVEDGSLAEIVSMFVYPTPLYAENVAGMTEESALYVNGQDGYLYRYNGSSWMSTGIKYSSGIVQLFVTAQSVTGSLIVEYDANTLSGTFRWNTNTPRITLKDGSIFAPGPGSFTVPNTNLHYLCYNAVSGTYDIIAHNEINKASQPSYSILFGIYMNLIIPYGIPIISNANTVSSKRGIKTAEFARPMQCEYVVPNLTVYNGRFVLSNGDIAPAIDHETFVNPYPGGLAYFVYDKLNQEYKIESYVTPEIYTGTHEIIACIYAGRLTRNDIDTENALIYSVLLSGAFFVSMQGDYFHVETNTDARIMQNGVVTHFDNVSVDVQVPEVSTASYLCVSNDGFYVKPYNKLTSNDLWIAKWYLLQLFTPYPDAVALNTVKIGSFYQRQGYRYNINYDRLHYGLYPYQKQNNNNIRNYGDFVQLVNAWNATPAPRIYYRLNDTKWYVGPLLSVVQNTATLANKKVLMIGDSISNRGWLQAHMTAAESGIQFVGTIETGTGDSQTNPQYNHDYMCEAVPGASVETFFESSSNFYNPETETFDFSYYVQQNSIIPDMVTIQFGLNEGERRGTEFKQLVQQMIDSIKAYSSTIKIYVVTPFRRRLGAHTNKYATNYSFYKFDLWRTMSCYKLTDCVIIPAWYLLNDEMDYVYTDINVNYGNLTVRGCEDNIHPYKDTGFLMLANIILGYLGL